MRLDADEGALAASFVDIAQFAARCRFRDCRHEQEPGCAVREQVAPQRLRSYQKLLREAQRDTLSALQRKQQVALWKARSRAARSRSPGKTRLKRGDPGYNRGTDMHRTVFSRSSPLHRPSYPSNGRPGLNPPV